jgi:hypothetical protein
MQIMKFFLLSWLKAFMIKTTHLLAVILFFQKTIRGSKVLFKEI